ncbi:phage antirepressor N-terminal domain-containing protein [Streptosporangium sp. NBC_01495]|uniref:phage antirepressor N-terminal domain-containing protein n=1 Tax=Streptosporangium sp. NBC_01495 TaxID=2903899 RepID=UPI002E35165B|nr:phage antirepressor N-terminal domain-containing protein [Streptosporangium sp. NBC_01495]
MKLSTGELYTYLEDGVVEVFFRPAVEALGLSVEAQVRKLKSRSWAWTAQRAVQLPGDIQVRTHRVVDRKTLTMWLATINENNVPEEKRDQLVTFQKEAADALDRYWHEGGVVNHRATVEQLDELDRTVRRAREQAAVLAALRGIVDGAWLDARGRHVAAVALGMEPDIDLADRPLTVGEYLETRGLTGNSLRSLSPSFGKRVKALYRQKHGAEPSKVDRFIDGALRPVAAYTEAHRDLFDQAWLALLDTR